MDRRLSRNNTAIAVAVVIVVCGFVIRRADINHESHCSSRTGLSGISQSHKHHHRYHRRLLTHRSPFSYRLHHRRVPCAQ